MQDDYFGSSSLEDVKIDYDLLSNADRVEKSYRFNLKPPESLLVSEWADKYRILSRKASNEPGLWRTSRTPYLKRPMDVLSQSSPHQEVVVMKGAQVGFTEAGLNWLGYIIDHAPGPCMMVMPTDSGAKRNVKTRLEPMIDESPRLKLKIGEKKHRDSENTNMLKSFPGGVFIATGGNSAIALRSSPIKYLFLDEEDAMPLDLDGEGSPVELAKARTRTFGSRKKIFRISTPVYEDTSTIKKAYENSSQEMFHVPCPFCGFFQPIEWKQIIWEDDDPETVRMECLDCKAWIKEFYKTKLLQKGEWIAKEPLNPVIGFHISSLYSPLGWFSWKDAVRQFLAAKDNDEKMKTFYNTVLGETWKERGDAPDWKNIYLKREVYDVGVVPLEVSFLTQAVDIQKDRIELEVVGWGPRKQNWSITHEIIEGDTSRSEVWDKLKFYIEKTYPIDNFENPERMPIRITAIDSGYNTQMVYNFCRNYQRSQVVAVKGSATSTVPVQIPKALDVRNVGVRAKYKRRGMRVWTVGVSIIKSEIYAHLRLDKPTQKGQPYPDNYYHFPEYGEEYFKQMTAEQLVKKLNRNNFYVYEWMKIRDRNEILDLKVYNRAASIILGIDRMSEKDFMRLNEWKMSERESVLEKTKNQSEKPKKSRKKSSYWD